MLKEKLDINGKGYRKLLQHMIVLFVAATLFTFAFEGIWYYQGKLIYASAGLFGLAIVIFSIIDGCLLFNIDTFLLLSFLGLGWISTVLNFGVTIEYFYSRFFCVMMFVLALYYTLQIIPDADKLLKLMFFIITTSLGILCIFVLFKATSSVVAGKPQLDITRGCFKNGRLCAVGNANVYAFACVSLVMAAGIRFLDSKGFWRVYYGIFAVLGWFCLGLTGSRTGAIGVGAAAGILIFSLVYRRFVITGNRKAVRLIAALCFSGLIAALIVESFLLPSMIYKGIMHVVLPGESTFFNVRHISDDDGTMSDRTIIWAATIKSFFANPKRFLFGLSPTSKADVAGIYPGRHEITAVHSHSALLEMMRLYGFWGLMIFLVLLINWGVIGFKILFHENTKTGIRYLTACAAGMLIMGIAEPVPLMCSIYCYLTVPFFIICGYCYRIRRKVQ